MSLLVRFVAIGISLCILVVGLIFKDEVQLKYFSEPVILVLVLDLMILLGFITYAPRRLWDVFRGIFMRQSMETHPRHRRVIGQMALYALISGILLSVYHVLAHRSEIIDHILRNSDSDELRFPLMTLLYGVLAAIGLWAASGMDKPISSGETVVSDRPQVIMAFCTLLLTIGVLSVLIVGINRMAEGNKSKFDVPMDIVQGLQRGDDMVWRRVGAEKDEQAGVYHNLLPVDEAFPTVSKTSKDLRQEQVVGKRIEPPLRWELEANSERGYYPDYITVPALKQN